MPSDSVKNGNPADLTSNDINIMSTDKTERNPLIESMPELNRRIMKLFQTAEAEADMTTVLKRLVGQFIRPNLHDKMKPAYDLHGFQLCPTR